MYDRSRVEFGIVEHYPGNFGNLLVLAQYDGALPRNGTIGGIHAEEVRIGFHVAK